MEENQIEEVMKEKTEIEEEVYEEIADELEEGGTENE